MKQRVLALSVALLLACTSTGHAQAPAAAPAAATPAPAQGAPAAGNLDWLTYKNPYVAEQTDISNPHRTQEEIIDWTSNMIADVLSFNPEEFNQKLATLKPNFAASAWAQYAAYLKESGFVEQIRVKQLSASTIIDGGAAVTNKGAAGGVYHWVVNAPIIISFTKMDETIGEPVTVSGGHFKLTLQVGRIPARPGEDGLVIETWKMTGGTAD